MSKAINLLGNELMPYAFSGQPEELRMFGADTPSKQGYVELLLKQAQASKQEYKEALIKQEQESCKHTMRRYSALDCVMQECKKCGLVERLR